MRTRAAILLSLLLVGCSTTVAPEVPVRVMTWNIRLNLASDGPNAWPHRKDIAANIIRDSDADLLGVQEALPDQLADLDQRLPHFRRFGVGRTKERSGEYSAIYYRKDRFEVL